MNRNLYTALILLSCILLNAQHEHGFTASSFSRIDITEQTILYKLADNIVPIKIRQYGDRDDVVFINLHDDEATSVEATRKILEEHGGMLIEIENNAQRNIRFRSGSYFYRVDPNRVFSNEGIAKSLKELGRTSAKAEDEVAKFGQRIIQLIPDDAKCVVSLHNNTPGLFSAKEYSPGYKRSIETKKIYLNPGEDADDFFLTTDNLLYEKLADRGFNTILQDNKHCTDDGSLSVYCGKNKIRYVNCETEHGKSQQYYQMMKALINELK
jgi:hypothetical protein